MELLSFLLLAVNRAKLAAFFPQSYKEVMMRTVDKRGARRFALGQSKKGLR